ncbi:MAG TPA: dTMP kinase [Patescibacteria group bacterium]|nr:dTMP kinase [Patescibacteria group bacterium]
MKTRFITFEGSEGCGKSTQSRLLYLYLKKRGWPVVYLREPGGTGISESIRRMLLDHKSDRMSQACEMLLYMAARAQLVDEVIRPALAQGKVIICDRFLDSTVAYQGYGLGIDIKTIRSIGLFATAGIRPDLTILLDLPVKEGLRHRNGSEDRIEKRSFNYHQRVRQGYLAQARQEPRRIKVVRLAPDKDTTQQAIRCLVEAFLKGK